jgi:hypothetical protein
MLNGWKFRMFRIMVHKGKGIYKINKRMDDIMTQRDCKRALCIILKAGGSEVKDIKDNNNNYTIQCSISVYNL